LAAPNFKPHRPQLSLKITRLEIFGNKLSRRKIKGFEITADTIYTQRLINTDRASEQKKVTPPPDSKSGDPCVRTRE
jgi:hypothetical protein